MPFKYWFNLFFDIKKAISEEKAFINILKTQLSQKRISIICWRYKSFFYGSVGNPTQ